jgi:hypothetical protein
VQSIRSNELYRVQDGRNCAEYKMEGTVQSTRQSTQNEVTSSL